MMRASQRGGLKSGDLIIGSSAKGTHTFSTVADPVVHTTMALARQEAARLAALDKSKKYAIMKVEALASVQDVAWE